MTNQSSDLLRIAIVGRGKEGKAVFGEHLRLHYGFKRKSLADPLLEFIRKLYWYNRHKRIPWELRLDWYDTFYKQDNDVWVRNLEHRLEQQQVPWIVDDVRYINEVEYLRKLGFLIVRVISPVKVFKGLGKNYTAGTLFLAESYSKDFTVTLAADYTFSYTKPERYAFRDSIDFFMEGLKVDK